MCWASTLGERQANYQNIIFAKEKRHYNANPAPMCVTPATPNEGVHTDSLDARAAQSAVPRSSTLTPYSGILRSRQGRLRSQHQPEVMCQTATRSAHAQGQKNRQMGQNSGFAVLSAAPWAAALGHGQAALGRPLILQAVCELCLIESHGTQW